MVVNTQPRIKSEKRGYILAHIDISGHFVFGFIDELGAKGGRFRTIPRTAAEVLIVHTEGDAVALEEARRFVD